MIDNSFGGTSNFSMVFYAFPEVVFYMQEFQVPEIRLPTASVNSMTMDIRIAGEKLEYDQVFTMNYALDEQLITYSSLVNWLVKIRNPSDITTHLGDWRQYSSDAMLIVRGNNMQEITRFHFVNCYPVSVAGPLYKTNESENNVQLLQAGFNYDYFMISPINEPIPGFGAG
jgi:hypothetical protein